MRRRDVEDGFVSEAEAEAARSLADAVEGGDGSGSDAEALAVVRLLASLRERPEDELAARRGAARAAAAIRSAARRRFAVRFLSPLAAALLLAVGLSGRRAAPPAASGELVAERETQARAAIASLAGDASAFRSARAGMLLAKLSESRFDSYRRERAATLGTGAKTAPVPTERPSGGRT